MIARRLAVPLVLLLAAELLGTGLSQDLVSAQGETPQPPPARLLYDGLLDLPNLPSAAAAAHGAPALAPKSAVQQSPYGQLPLLFVENRGQADPQVAFTLQGNAATVFFTPTGVTYALVEPAQADANVPPDPRLPAAHAAAAPKPALAPALGCQARFHRRQPRRPARRPGPRRNHRLLLPRPARRMARGAAHFPAPGLSQPVARH